MAAGAGRLCTDVSTQVEVIIMGAGAVTRFPLLQADLTTHVQSQLFFAEVRRHGGGAVVIAEAMLAVDVDTRAGTLHVWTRLHKHLETL